MGSIISFQEEFSQRLPLVVGNTDYNEFRNTLHRIEELIELGHLEKPFINYRLQKVEKEFGSLDCLNAKEMQNLIQRTQEAFRSIIVLKLTGLSFRRLAERLADSPLLQKFCLLSRIDKIKVPSKSQLERYEKMFTVELLNEVMDRLNQLASTSHPTKKNNPLKLDHEISLKEVYVDATCVEANIHYPVDWVLLRDATRTLMKAVTLIRKAGLKNRMDSPIDFIRSMNKLCIKMTHARNRITQKKDRKKIYRLMKKLLKKIEKHAMKHKRLLDENWQETELTERKVNQILRRIENVLEKLPDAVHQASERIIGERHVKNEDKLLSLYEDDIHVCVRGKSGVPVEFGNTLTLAEQANGVIVDWKLYQEQSPGDPKLLRECLERIKNKNNKFFSLKNVTTDRGMCSVNNQKFLKKNKIQDFMCPRSPHELKSKLKKINFCIHQKRRAQTEGRIGIVKQKFLGDPLRSKSFHNRKMGIAWALFTHNLWVIARLPRIEEKLLKNAA